MKGKAMSVIRMKDHGVAKSGNWKVWAERINAAWQKSVEGIIEAGQLLIKARDDLSDGSFKAMMQLELSFGPATASKLITIAENHTITNVSHAKQLPPSWDSLYKLAQADIKLGEGTLAKWLTDGTITPKTERKEIMELLAVSDEKKAPKKKPAAKQKSGPKTDPSTKDAFVDELKQLSKAQQVDEIFGVMGQLGLTFIDFGVSTLNLRKGK
jgi:hypothetical protein